MASAASLVNRKSKRKYARRPSKLLGYDDVVDSSDVFGAEQKEHFDLIEKQGVYKVREFFARGPVFDASQGEIGRVALRLAIYNERG